MHSTIEEMIRKHAERTPDKLAIAAMNGDLTYAELLTLANKAAGFLKDRGIKKSDRVLLSAVPIKEYFAVYFGLHMLGAICVPAAVNAKPELLNHIIKNTNAACFFASEDSGCYEIASITYNEIYSYSGTDNLTDADIHMGDIADIIYTTGTTGLAKGVVLRHEVLEAGAHNIINAVDMQEDEVILAPLPLNHSNALGTMRAFLYKGASLIVHNGFTNIKSMEERLNSYRCTAFSGAPSGLKIIDRATRGHIDLFLKNMRYVEIGTAPMDMELKRKMMQALPHTRLLINYGATEARRAVYMDLNSHPDKLKSIGKPVKNMAVKIIDEDNQVIQSSENKIGRLVICGKTCMKGYWNNPALSKKVLAAGGLATSDLAYIDKDGFIFLVGRANDVINVGGKKVSPFEIEDALMTNEKIVDCACIPVKDKNSILGNVPIMFVVVRKDRIVEKNELKNYLLKKLETYKIPVEFIEIEELPKNYVGKLDRERLKNIWETRYKQNDK